MKPSERIHLIKDISDALAPEPYRIIDLTLRQFELPWTNEWQGDSEGYVIDMISGASDVVLVELAKHVGVVTEFESVSSPGFWNENEPRIFISHLAKKKTFATSLKEELMKFGIIGFVAHEDIEPSKEWQIEIELGLNTMDGMIAILHPEFHESNWTDQELGVAIGRMIPIIPIHAGLIPYGFIGKYQALKAGTKSIEQLTQEVIEIFASKPKIASKISRALVEKLKLSKNWAQSKQIMDLIEKCQQFSPETVAELTKALNNNGQVSSAWGVPERIKQIVERHGA